MAINNGYEDDEISGSARGKGGNKSTSFFSGKNGGLSNSSASNSRLSDPKYLAATSSNNPQAIFKMASHPRGASVRNVINYIARSHGEESIEIEDEMGAAYTGKKEINEIYKEWAEDFEEAKPNAKRLPRHASHFILSGDIEPTQRNVDKVKASASKTCRELLHGYQYLIGVHQEGGKAHAHVIVKAKSPEIDVPKLRIGPTEMQILRENFANNLTELGLSHVATLRRDRPKTIEKIRDGQEPLKSKTKNHFSYMLGKNKNAEYHQALSSSVVKLRMSVEKAAINDKTRYFLKQSIRRFEKCLLENPDQKREHISNLYQSFTQYRHLFKAELKAIASPVKRQPSTPDKSKVSNIIDIKAYRDIKTARAKINNIEDPQKKNEALQSLDKHSLAVIGRPLSSLKDRDLPPDEMIKQLKRNIAQCQGMYKALDGTLDNKYLSFSDRTKCNKEIEKLDKRLSNMIKSSKVVLESQQLPKGVKERYIKEISAIQIQHSKQRSKSRGLER